MGGVFLPRGPVLMFSSTTLLGLLYRLLYCLKRPRSRFAARDSVPLRIACPTLDAVPPAAELAALAVVGRHVVLHLPEPLKASKGPLIERLAEQLPGHSVFDSGGKADGTTCITVLEVIDERRVLENLPVFLAALADFTATATRPCHALAAAHGVPAAMLLAHREAIERRGRAWLRDWDYGFHGLECEFVNVRTGQVLDVKIGCGEEFGLLDPYFLSGFVRTTPAHRAAADLLADDFHDMARVLDVLTRHGYVHDVRFRSVDLPDVEFRGRLLAPAYRSDCPGQ